MLTRPLFSFLITLTVFRFTTAVTQIALFTDTNCQNSLRGVEGPNGYPNGTCTDFRSNGPYGSFHVVGMDPGCTVTIYTADDTGDMCSATAYQKEISLVDCYNSTFVYYSIDFCNSPRSPSPSSAASSKSSTGAIVGGVVGGVVVLGILIGVGVYAWMRRRGHGELQQEVSGAGIAELNHESKPMELDTEGGMMAYKQVQQPPVELAGREMWEDEGGSAARYYRNLDRT